MKGWLNWQSGVIHRRRGCVSARGGRFLTPVQLPAELADVLTGQLPLDPAEGWKRELLALGVPCARCFPELVERWPGETAGTWRGAQEREAG